MPKRNSKPKYQNLKLKNLSQRISESKRDDAWLLLRLNRLWFHHFADILLTNPANPVIIKFGRFSKFRLGSVRLEKVSKKTYITITSLFKDETIPVAVVDQTIAHELVHYTHGFSSYRRKMHKYPHEGGIVNRELKLRGLIHLINAYKKWVQQYRRQISTL